MKRKLETAEEEGNVLVVATDRSRRQTKGAKWTGAGVVVKQGKNIVWRGAWGLGRKSDNHNGESFAMAAGMSIAKHLAEVNSNIKSIPTVIWPSQTSLEPTPTHPNNFQFYSLPALGNWGDTGMARQ